MFFIISIGLVWGLGAKIAMADWTQQAKLTNPNPSAFDEFGDSVAVSGDTAVIGVPKASLNQGAAYVFVCSGGVWTVQWKLSAPDGDTNEYFGHSVAISGDTVVVGAHLADTADDTPYYHQGAVYVFVRSGDVWTLQQKLTASNPADDDTFGSSVAVSGDTAVIGATEASASGTSRPGSAYVFVRSSGVWTQQQKLTASGGVAGDSFGFSVALSGETVVVGAAYADVMGYVDRGAAYVFVRSGGVWTQQQKLTASGGEVGDWFGWSVAVSGDTAVVGASGWYGFTGAAYVFVRSGSVWTMQQELTGGGIDEGYGEKFGYSVVVSGDMAMVGAYDAVVNGYHQGATYVFARNNGVWTQQQKLVSSDWATAQYGWFGYSVAVSGGTAVVGMPDFDVGDARGAGVAYVFQQIFNNSYLLWTK